ncbi:MAG: gamma carbonic anhydrase family protein [Clostridia bacterium]|nr:gamma carbonic anhydrase family protein [Clostridia bacterium]
MDKDTRIAGVMMIQKYKQYLPEIDESCYVAPNSIIIGNVKIGKNSSIWYNTVIRGDTAKITIGSCTNLQDGCILHCSHDKDLIIGNNVTVGHGAILHSCIVDEGCLVGMGAIILDGVKIGKNCLVAAGALLTPNTQVPDNSLVLGNPGIIKRQLTDEEVAKIKMSSQEYIRLANEYKNDIKL